MTKNLNYNQIQSDLEQFIGTTGYYRLPIFKFSFLITDGVKYFCDLCPENEVIMVIIATQIKIHKLENEMQFIYIVVKDKEITIFSEPDKGQPHFWDDKAYIGDDKELPDGEYRIWYYNNVFLLPSEY